MTDETVPYLRSAILTVHLGIDKGPVVPSKAYPDRRIKVDRIEYEIDAVTGHGELWAFGRPTAGRVGTARGGALVSDETLAEIDDDTRRVWEQQARAVVAALAGFAEEAGET